MTDLINHTMAVYRHSRMGNNDKVKKNKFRDQSIGKKDLTDYTRKYCSHCKTETHNTVRCYFFNDKKLKTEKQNNKKSGNNKINEIGMKNSGPGDIEKELDKQYLRFKQEEENRQYKERPSGNPEIYSINRTKKFLLKKNGN
jgi:hypothetical protein